MAAQLRACARLMRIVNSLMVGFAVLVGIAIVVGRDIVNLPLTTLVLAYVTGFTISASSMVLNDIVDIDIDRINAPDRPLVSGAVSLRTAYACYAILSLLGVIASLLIGWEALAVAVAGWLVGSLYDVWGKRSGFPGNVMVAFSTSLPFPYAMAVVEAWRESTIIFWAMVFLTVLGREIVKDIADVEGDRHVNARTLPIVIGEGPSAVIAAILYVVAVALSPIPVIIGGVEPLSYGVFIAVVDFILLYESIRIVKDHSRATALRHKRNVLIAMLLGLIGFMLGTLLG